MSGMVRFRIVLNIIVWSICLPLEHVYFAVGFSLMSLGYPLAKTLLDNRAAKRATKSTF